MLQSGDIIKGVNKGTRSLTITIGGRNYTLPPDRETAIPFDAAVLWFGDPRSIDVIKAWKDEQGIVTWIPDRPTEIRRLRLKWGIHFGDARMVAGGVSPDGEADPPPPSVELFTLEGERLYSVIDDPEGTHVSVVKQTVSEQNDLLLTIQRQQRQIDMLLQATGMDEGAIPNVGANDPPSLTDIPEDDSEASRTASLAYTSEPLDVQ